MTLPKGIYEKKTLKMVAHEKIISIFALMKKLVENYIKIYEELAKNMKKRNFKR